jgi:hypothetical protein
MATPTNPFDDKIKIFNYVQTLLKCSGDSDETTYRRAVKDKDCKKTIESYFREETYNRLNPAPRRGLPVGAIAPQFVQAFFVALRYFKMLDPSTNNESWDGIRAAAGVPLAQALLDIVYATAVPGAVQPAAGDIIPIMAGGGDDFNFSKIIKLSKNEPEGFVPYLVNNIAGTYTDEYLDEMNSKIKKHFNQFGGFKKTTKDVIGSLEDLDRLLRDDLATQVNNAVYKRYYKSYPVTYQTGGVYGAHGAIVKEAYDMYRNSTPEQKAVIDCIGRFEFYTRTPVPVPGGPVINYTFNRTIEKMNGEDLGALGDGFIRFNLHKIRNPGGKYDKYTNLVSNVAGAVPAAGLPARPGLAIRSIPILLLMLPDTVNYSQLLGTAFNYWYGIPNVGVAGNHFDLEDGTAIRGAAPAGPFQGAIALSVLQATANNNIDTNCSRLALIISCDDDLYERLVKNDLPDGDEGEYQFANKYDKHFLGSDRNRYRYDENTKKFERKKADGTYETIDPIADKKKFKEFFNTDDKCFNSYFRTANSQQCCDAMKLLMEGKTTEFIKEVGSGNIGFGSFDESFKDLNPYSVVKFLEGFKFPKIKEYSPIHGTVTKFPNYKYWKTNVLKTLPELTSQQKTTIEQIAILENFLDMSVAFVNGNVNILNPHIDSMKSSGNVDANLESRNVRRLVIEPYSPLEARWLPLRKTILGNMMKTNNFFSPVYPFGQMFGGQQFTLHGGGDKNTEVVLDDFEIRPTFASQIAEDIKTIINNLKNNNKFLRSKEMKDINDQLNKYAELEVKLYEKILLINKYIKIAYYLNDNERESLSDNTIKTKIAEYLEYFKDYSNKDMELKNLGSVLRSMINDKL